MRAIARCSSPERANTRVVFGSAPWLVWRTDMTWLAEINGDPQSIIGFHWVLLFLLGRFVSGFYCVVVGWDQMMKALSKLIWCTNIVGGLARCRFRFQKKAQALFVYSAEGYLRPFLGKIQGQGGKKNKVWNWRWEYLSAKRDFLTLLVS